MLFILAHVWLQDILFPLRFGIGLLSAQKCLVLWSSNAIDLLETIEEVPIHLLNVSSDLLVLDRIFRFDMINFVESTINGVIDEL